MAVRFPAAILAAIDREKIIGIKAGPGPHRTIGIWAVVVSRRVFVRSWDGRAGGWYHTLADDPRGTIETAGRRVPVRAIRTRSERLIDRIDAAYAAKYRTPGSLKYVRGFRRPTRRSRTMELVPRPAR